MVFICFGFFVFYEGFVSGYSVVVFGGSSVSFLPAPGFRDALSGGVGGSANHGYSWSCSTDKINCVYLHFYTLDLSPTNAYYRAHGFQLRCLSE
ncbi:hypothetical protein [uncultured Rikenella sp.]|uniref:hypothetical protein n=1 Tax=uncultured Rikenella sp. TaxID=368003 RepID=UPI002633A96B|nr:hypothetical protein [uncultured Rikenella sp.]